MRTNCACSLKQGREVLKVKEYIVRDGLSDPVIYLVWVVVVELGTREGRSRRPFLPWMSPGLGLIEGTSASFAPSWDDTVPETPPRLLSAAVTIIVILSSGAQGTARQITLPLPEVCLYIPARKLPSLSPC